MLRITSLILSLFCLIPLSAQTILEESISIDIEEETIPDALFTLSEHTDINITFSPKLFPSKKKIDIRAVDQPLGEILQRFFANTDIGFRLETDGIILFRKPPVRYPISGYLTDGVSNDRLVGANIIDLNSLEGVASNAYGFFSLNLRRGKVRLQISYLGYKTKTVELDLQKGQQIEIALEPCLTLKEVVVVARQEEGLISDENQSTTLPLQWMSHMPAAGGETDIIRNLQFLPGVQTGGDGFGGLHVRGGNSDQNLILYDDVPIYNPSHSFGLYSVFNPDIVKSVKFYKGAFPARYDSRLSSILDVRTREANDQKFSGELSLGSMASSGLLEIPIVKNKGSLLVAARRTHIDLWLKPFSRQQKASEGLQGEMSYYFADFNIKANYALNPKNRIYLSFYRGEDEFSDFSFTQQDEFFGNGPQPGADFQEDDPLFFSYLSSNQQSINWGNSILSFRWNRQYNSKLFSNLTATYSTFSYLSEARSEQQVFAFDQDFLALRLGASYYSEITDYSLRADFDYFLNQEHHLRFGSHLTNRIFTPGLLEQRATGIDLDSIPEIDEPSFDEEISIYTQELSFYLEDEFRRGDWTVNAGLRSVYFNSDRRRDLVFQPRLAVAYALNHRYQWSISASKTSQFVHLLTRADAGLPNDLWVPVGASSPPQHAWQISTGINAKLGENRRFRLEGYWKKMDNLFRINRSKINNEVASLNDLRIDAENWEHFVEKGSGESYGIEATIEQQKGAVTGWLTYTYSKATRSFDAEDFAFSFDSRHSLSLTSNWQITDNIDFSLSWLFQSGRPIALNDIGEGDIPFISLLEASALAPDRKRLPAYHRMDLGLNFHVPAKTFQHKFQLGLYNAYNRKNVFFAYQAQENSGVLVPQVVYGLPILPSFNYSVSW